VRSGGVSPDRITLSTGRGQRRDVLTLGYDGGRQGAAARQPAIAAPANFTDKELPNDPAFAWR
jgi:hypothetical protein